MEIVGAQHRPTRAPWHAFAIAMKHQDRLLRGEQLRRVHPQRVDAVRERDPDSSRTLSLQDLLHPDIGEPPVRVVLAATRAGLRMRLQALDIAKSRFKDAQNIMRGWNLNSTAGAGRGMAILDDERVGRIKPQIEGLGGTGGSKTSSETPGASLLRSLQTQYEGLTGQKSLVDQMQRDMADLAKKGTPVEKKIKIGDVIELETGSTKREYEIKSIL